MNLVYDNTELYHYGVLGMKWGKRKAMQKASEAYVNKTRELGGKAGHKFGVTVGVHKSHKAKREAKAAARNAYKETMNETPMKKASEAYINKTKELGGKAGRKFGVTVGIHKSHKAKREAKKESRKVYKETMIEIKREARRETLRKGAAVAGIAIAAYGAMKIKDMSAQKESMKKYALGKAVIDGTYRVL